MDRNYKKLIILLKREDTVSSLNKELNQINYRHMRKETSEDFFFNLVTNSTKYLGNYF